jgi:molecular chaperone HscB
MKPGYFDLFSLPVLFQTDMSALKKRFYQLSREFHPDYHTHVSEVEQAAVTEKYALINQAFKVLSDEYSRRQYILEMKGVLTGSDEKLPADFLMEMMELNEEIDSMLTSESEIARSGADEVISSYEHSLKASLQDLESASDNTGHSDNGLLVKIKECHLKTRYLLRIREKVANIAAP